MKQKNRILAVFLVCLMVLGLAACGKKADSDKPGDTQNSSSNGKKQWKIGFSNSFSGNIWRSLMLAELDQAMEGRTDVDLIIADGQNDTNKQVSDIENLIAQGVDGIMIIPGSAQAVEPALKEAREKGIKVIVFNLALNDEEAYDVYVGTDMVKKSEMMSTWLFEKIGGKGNIVMLGGTSGNSGTAIMKGEAERIMKEKYPDINVLQYRDADWKEDKAKQIMTDLLLAYPNQIDGVWTDGGQNASGAIKAMAANGKEMIPLTGNGVYNSVFGIYQEMHDKFPDFDFALTPEPTYQSGIALDTMVDLLNGKEFDKKVILDVKLHTGKDAALYDPRLPDNMPVDHKLTEENLEKYLNTQKK